MASGRTQGQRVVVANPADGGFFYWLFKLYLFGGISALLMVLGAMPLLYMQIAAKAPAAPNLRDYPARAALATQIHALDGRPLATVFKERRELVDVRDVPPMLIKAFMAAEDRKFFSHGGVDFRGIMRAAWANLKAGGVKQGGSTITQQVAKAHLSPERTIERKLNELVLARRIEARYSKEEILGFYLNHTFFGSNAYGVKAAAHEYFGKELKEMRVSEMAMLAGLVRAPSRYSPRRNHARAKRRRNTVLRAMRDAGYIDAKQLKMAKADALELVKEPPYQDPMHWVAPHFTEHVRRLLVRRYGKEKVSTAGWRVHTTVSPTLNKLARRHVLSAVESLDKRRGWRGPVARGHTPAQRARILARLEKLYGPLETLRSDYRYLALVEKVSSRRIRALVGKRQVEIPLALMEWAAPYSATNPENSRKIESARGLLRPGDLIWVVSPPRWLRRRSWGSAEEKVTKMALDQRPIFEGTLFTYDHQTGYVLTMIGGLDYDRSNYNRVVQACRQPASAFKPFYYSLALENPKLSMGTVLQDKPYTPEPGEQWNPQNVHGTLSGEVTMHYALVKSLNLASIDLLRHVGFKETSRWARRLGLSTIDPRQAEKVKWGLALGTQCVRMDEMGRAFGTFARGGSQQDPIYIRQVRDRRGQLVEDHTFAADPLLSEDERLDRIWATALPEPRPVIDSRTAYLMTKLLRDSVVHGIAARCQIVPVPTAGKGGTSGKRQDGKARVWDLWFVGFTSQWATVAWVGDDKNRSLGEAEGSYTTAIPMWANFMKNAVGKRPHKELPSSSNKGLRATQVDFLTGGAPQPGRKSVTIYYRPGSFTPPAASATAPGPG